MNVQQPTYQPDNSYRLSAAASPYVHTLWQWDLRSDEVSCSHWWNDLIGCQAAKPSEKFSVFVDNVHPEDRQRLLDQVDLCRSGKESGFSIEVRLRRQDGSEILTVCQAFLVYDKETDQPVTIIGSNTDVTRLKSTENFNKKTDQTLEMIAIGRPASEIYDVIALMYEERNPGIRCSMLELEGNSLLHGGAPSLPEEYCQAVHGLTNGPEVGSCGTSTYTGKRCLVEDIETDPKWKDIKQFALPHGLRCCWSEPIKNSSGKVLGAFGMYRNYKALPSESELQDLISAARLASIVMERDQAQKRIHQLAFTDELTGLASRASFYQKLEELIVNCRRHSRRFYLLYIDLDDFKAINDSLGHDIGDQYLKKIGDRLKKFSRENELVARLGGDEFCLLVESLDDDYSIANITQRWFDNISSPIELHGRNLSPSCSIGIARYPDDGIELGPLLKAADTALYAAKEAGKNQYAFYNEELTQQVEQRFKIEKYLREAIENQQLTLDYQAQVDLNSQKIVGVEALCRWHHPELGQVPPSEFIPIAEKIGMIKQLTDWVLNKACEQAVKWHSEGYPSLKIAVNISPTCFERLELVEMVEQVIQKTTINPENLQLEVTENVFQVAPNNVSIFQALKKLGLLLAIDDFGTGYSSFYSLKKLEFDVLKIDRLFVHDLLKDKSSRLLLNAMVEMGHNLGHQVIAEGIELEEEMEILKSMGCESAQGYFFCKPTSAEEIQDII